VNNNHIGEYGSPDFFDVQMFREMANKPRQAFSIAEIKDTIRKPGDLEWLTLEPLY